MPAPTFTAGEILTAAKLNLLSAEADAARSDFDGHTHTASEISDATSAGIALLTGVTAAAQRSSLGLGTAAVAATGDFAAASHTHTASAITDFTEAAQDVVGAMVAAAGGSYDDGAGTITLPSGGSVAAADITDATSVGIAIITAADAAAGRTALGLGTAATQASTAFAAASHTQAASTITDFTEAAQDVVGAMIAAAGGTYNDGAGTITLPAAGTVAAADLTDATATGIALITAASAAAARTTLGLGTIATQGANDVAITGGSIAGRLSNGVSGAEVVYDFGSGGADDSTKSPLWINAEWRGTPAAAASGWQTSIAPARIRFEDRTATSEPGGTAALLISHILTGNQTANELTQRQKTALLIKQTLTGKYGDVTAPVGYMPFVGLQIENTANASQGGLGSWDGIEVPDNGPFRGNFFGLNVLSILRGPNPGAGVEGALNYIECTGAEIVVSPWTDTNPYHVMGLHIGRKEEGNARGFEDDAIEISSASGTNGGGAAAWKVGIKLGRVSGSKWPFASDSDFIRAVVRQWPTPAQTRANNPMRTFIDAREITFSGPALRFPGFEVRSDGAMEFTPLTSDNPTANGQVTFERVSNTQLRIKMRGTDGTVRATTVTLS